ncbi:hypothetical protein [Macrococcus sp. DPC7161]|uniref:hypothetical protein n=1 Tax=Macrococcus sp. DPC7161 TaxID=2507060 RepID=UPI00100C03E3|nr:hypothetical protein [Macrococcus sp. DPC7161]RXK19078.1 hypothetical protein ER639_01830 [Macrococcus sp. DPC7161]
MELIKEFINHKAFVDDKKMKEYTGYLFRFNNGYGVSVINNHSTNGARGLELTILKNDSRRNITNITDEFIPNLNINQVLVILDKIEKLEKENVE